MTSSLSGHSRMRWAMACSRDQRLDLCVRVLSICGRLRTFSLPTISKPTTNRHLKYEFWQLISVICLKSSRTSSSSSFFLRFLGDSVWDTSVSAARFLELVCDEFLLGVLDSLLTEDVDLLCLSVPLFEAGFFADDGVWWTGSCLTFFDDDEEIELSALLFLLFDEGEEISCGSDFNATFAWSLPFEWWTSFSFLTSGLEFFILVLLDDLFGEPLLLFSLLLRMWLDEWDEERLSFFLESLTEFCFS